MKNYLKIIQIDEYSITPKYQQIANSILHGIESGQIEKDEILPSINDLSFALEASRNTVERAYKELKKTGAVDSVAGKGYFISGTQFNRPVKILLLFNKLSVHKKILYDTLAEKLGSNASIDFYIYNNDFNFFKKLLVDRIEHYSKIVIIPHFVENSGKAFEVINTIPKDKLILMDKLVPGVTGEFGAVYENFEQDIYYALEHLLQKLMKYHTIKLVFPENTYHSKEIRTGFINFCNQYAFDYAVVSKLAKERYEKGTVYITLMEDDLVKVIENVLETSLTIGAEIGIISYNETPLKKLLLNGITTISTDFEMMGQQTANLVLENSTAHIPIPFKVTMRNSL